MDLEIECALVLAAGLGTRMRHLTENRPKPLIEVAGQRLIDRVLDRIADAGIARAVVNVHYKADQIEAAVQGRARPAIQISDERDALLDTGGGASRALPMLGAGPFLIHNSDSIWVEGVEPALTTLMRAWNNDEMDCLMLLAAISDSTGFDGPGDFTMARNGRLARRPKGVISPFVFAGVSIAHPRLFAEAPAGAYSLNAVWDQAIARNRLYGVRLDGHWMHVGTPEAVVAAEHLLTSTVKN
ncbi:MAG TPA: nucleotidyltransferase family protein [Hyphomicrobiaceae bacterium]|nr:nucleotidyltransferase family protein [Hyphomicrobiaceae bacterium]